MDKDIVFRASLDDGGTGAKSLADLKKEFKAVNAELAKTKEGTDEYYKALQKLGTIKDDIGDLNTTINALNPEGKIGAFQNVAGKLAGGFQAATGAAALFGVEAEEVEKMLLKVQAATAFAEGIHSLSGLSDAFMVMSTVIKTSVIPALNTLKGALLATGIGAAAIALGILINEVLKYNEAIDEQFDKEKKLNEELQKTEEAYLKNAAAREKLRDAQKGNLNDLERELKLMQARGDSEDAIAKKRQEILDKEIFNLKAVRDNVSNNHDKWIEFTENIRDKENERQVIFEANEKRKRDELQKTLDAQKKKAQEEKELFENTISNQEDAQEKQREKDFDQKQEDKEKAQAEQDALAEYLSEAQAYEDEKAEANKERRKKDIDEMTAKEKAAAEQQKQIKIDAASTGLNATKSLSDAFFNYQLARAKGNQAEELKIRKKQFEVDKAFSIARAVIDGVRSVQAALTLPPPASYLLAAANGVLAAANIVKISSTKFDGGASSTSVDAPSINTNSAPTISTPEPPRQGPTTDLDRDGNNLSQQPIIVKAVVVETDMTNNQDRVSKLERQARF